MWWRLLLVGILLPAVFAAFSPTFDRFLVRRYGRGVAEQLNRRDIGPHGSYGGGHHRAGTKTRARPVILVHGVSGTASSFINVARTFKSSGYSDDSVYATTYGDGGKTPFWDVGMKCQYVKQVRNLIKAVAGFTRQKVNVIGYSMGSPISRKAIKGGKCVDTGEQLGPPLTPLMDTYVSVAGANAGSFLCMFPFGTCNMKNGLHCESAFIKDVNSREHYEGKNVFTISSRWDDRVGYYACGRGASKLSRATNLVRDGNHEDVMHHTAKLQVQLVKHHHP